MQPGVKAFWLLAAAASSVLADTEFTTPAAGASVQPGTISIAWKDSGVAPSSSEFTNYVINLCAGGNDQGTFLCSLATIVPNGNPKTGGLVAQGTVTATVGANSKNGYFLQMVSTYPDGQVTNYSPRFGMTGMTGTFPANVISGISDAGSSTDGPPTALTDNSANGANPVANAFDQPYNQQTGVVRYAPMAPQPGTKITAKSAKAQYPSSSVQIAKTWLAIPTVTTTYTQSATFSVSSMENTASPLPADPADDMAKFLARWRD